MSDIHIRGCPRADTWTEEPCSKRCLKAKALVDELEAAAREHQEEKRGGDRDYEKAARARVHPSQEGPAVPTLMPFDLRPIAMDEVRALCVAYHGYASAGAVAVYAWGVHEDGRLVAAYAWQPPPPGAAASVCPEAPYGVLALSRMVAVPKKERVLKHISKPLKKQMKRLIDRTRWPVLVTYSDEGEGHNGYTYQCSGWEKTARAQVRIYEKDGKRASAYSNGGFGKRELDAAGKTWVQRWEHWACARGEAKKWMEGHGWERVVVEGKVWRSGNPAYTFRRKVTQMTLL